MDTEKPAIVDCQKLWDEIEASGLSKWDFLLSPQGKKWLNKYLEDCPLCEYAKQFVDPCLHCPLTKKYGDGCAHLGYSTYEISSKEWFDAIRKL